jgi:hypothetical protein
MLAVGTRVKLKLDARCRHRHAAGADGRVGTIIAVVTEDVLASVPAAEPRAFLTLESFDGHVYSVELSESGGLEIELCAASELQMLPACGSQNGGSVYLELAASMRRMR